MGRGRRATSAVEMLINNDQFKERVRDWKVTNQKKEKNIYETGFSYSVVFPQFLLLPQECSG